MLFALPALLLPKAIIGLYLKPEDVATSALAASLLPIAAAFAVFDATQVAAAQALRGLKDVRIPMILTGISYWVLGFPIAAWLGLSTQLSAAGVWWGLLTSLVAAAFLLGGRLWAITKDAHSLKSVA